MFLASLLLCNFNSAVSALMQAVQLKMITRAALSTNVLFISDYIACIMSNSTGGETGGS